MRPLCVALLLALAVPGCSRFNKTARMDRAYYKQLEEVKAAREKRRENLTRQQRAEMKSASGSPPLLERQTVQPTPENQ